MSEPLVDRDTARALQRLFQKLDEEDLDTMNFLMRLARAVGEDDATAKAQRGDPVVARGGGEGDGMSESVQCRLRRGSAVQVAFIPESFARVGQVVRLKKEDGWRVVEVGARVSARYVQEHRDDHRTAFPSLA